MMAASAELETRKNAAIDKLTERYARDELPMEEYERLVADVNRARSPRELEVVEDIVGMAPSAGGFIDESQVQSCAAILAERTYGGKWLRKRNIAAATILASQVFDFRSVDLPPGQTTLEVLAVFGSVVIYVPEGVCVRMDAMPVLGSATVGRGVDTAEREGRPVLVVVGNAVFGSIEVKRK
jgi:hypothetical protein